MRSRTSERFREAFAKLPAAIQRQARDAYRLFVRNPSHPGLRFKPVHTTIPVYSVRVTRDYRALGVRDGDSIIWFWIGSHGEYEKLIARL